MRTTRSITRRAALAAGALGATLAVAGCGRQTPSGSGSTAQAASATRSTIDRLLDTMTLAEKVAQLFIVTPEQLTGVGVVTVAGEATRAALATMPVGGFIYFSANFESASQVRELLAGARELGRGTGAGVAPVLAVDEEGGPLVARVANSGLFDVPRVPAMAEIGATGDPARAAEVGSTIGSYLHDIGFDLDFAPVADVVFDPASNAIGPRAFGSDPELVASMVAAEVTALRATGTLPCVKHFPGHGATSGDSHTGAVFTTRTREQIEAGEFAPFRAAIEAGCPLVMVGHIETPNFAADGLPASLSPTMLTDVLRGELGFTGAIVSDSFSMGAITERMGSAEVAVRYLAAGGDIILIPANLTEAYQGVLDAVATGTLSEERIDESVRRILQMKDQVGLLA